MAMYQTAEQRRKQKLLDMGVSPNQVPAKPRTGSDPAPPKPPQVSPSMTGATMRAFPGAVLQRVQELGSPVDMMARATGNMAPAGTRVGDLYRNGQLPPTPPSSVRPTPVAPPQPIGRAIPGPSPAVLMRVGSRPNAPVPVPTAQVAPQAPTQQRLSGEMSMLEKERRHVIQQLMDLGPSYGQTPEQAARREQLIARRHLLETRGEAIGAAREPLPSATPAQASAARDRLMNQTGVDIRPDAEKAQAASLGNNRLIGGAGPTLARIFNDTREEGLYKTREMERAARAKAGMDSLMNPLPGQEPVLDAMARERQWAKQRELDTGTLEQTLRTRAIEDAKQGDPARRMAEAQIAGVQAESDLKKAQALNYGQDIAIKSKELADPNSVQNLKRSAEKAVAGREAAAAASGTAPGATLATAGELLNKIDTRFFEKSPWLMRMFNLALGPYDVGGNVATGQTIQQDMADLDALDTMVVRRLERLAAAGDQLNAAQDAAAVLAKIPRPINGHTYAYKSNIARPFAERLTSIRNRLQALVGQ